MSAEARHQIENLMYRYAEAVDQANFDEITKVFGNAKILLGAETEMTGAELSDMFKENILLYDGSPRTHHVTTNLIVDLSDDGTSAACRSYYTVFQDVDGLPLQPIICGRYHDKFRCEDGIWHFEERDYQYMDMPNDMSKHLRSMSG